MSVAISRLLSKLVEQAPTILAKLTGTGEDAVTPKEFLSFVRDIARAQAASSKSIEAIAKASRIDSGSPSALHEHKHLDIGAGAGPGPVPPLAAAERTPEEAGARLLHLARVHARLSEPLEYDGAERGIVEEEDEAETACVEAADGSGGRSARANENGSSNCISGSRCRSYSQAKKTGSTIERRRRGTSGTRPRLARTRVRSRGKLAAR